jgi:hypothetical protein
MSASANSNIAALDSDVPVDVHGQLARLVELARAASVPSAPLLAPLNVQTAIGITNTFLAALGESRNCSRSTPLCSESLSACLPAVGHATGSSRLAFPPGSSVSQAARSFSSYNPTFSSSLATRSAPGPASETPAVKYDVKINRQTTLDKMFIYNAPGTIIEYPETSSEGIGHLFRLDPKDWTNPAANSAYSLGEPSTRRSTTKQITCKVLTDSSGEEVPCYASYQTCQYFCWFPSRVVVVG